MTEYLFLRTGASSTVNANQLVVSDASGNIVSIDASGWNAATKAAAFNTLSPFTTRGDLVYRDPTTAVRLPIGTADQMLITDGIDPRWGGFLQPLTGAGERTFRAKVKEFIHATDFTGVDPTGATDSTTGLQAAITAAEDANKGLLLGDGTFKHTGLTLHGGKVIHIEGNYGSTFLVNTSTTSDDITIDNTTLGTTTMYLGGFTLEPQSQKTGGYAIRQTGDNSIHSGSVIENIKISTNSNGGIRLRATSDLLLRNIQNFFVNTNAIGLWLDGAVTHTIQLIIDNVFFKQGQTGATTTAIYVGDYTGFAANALNIQGGGPGGPFNIGMHFAGPNIADTWLVNSYSDACSIPVKIDGGIDIRFTNGFFGNGGNGFHGVNINDGDDITFENSLIYGNQRSNFKVASAVNDLKILNCTIGHGGFEGAGSNVYSDIEIDNNTNNFTIMGNSFHVAGFSDTSAFNIHVSGATHDNYTIIGNRTDTGISGGIADDGTGKNKIVAWNTRNPSVTNTPNGHYIGIQPLLFAGSTSGLITLRAPATAGTPVIDLPVVGGVLVSNTVAPMTINGNGTISITGAAGQVLAGSTPAFTATPTLGASGTLGSITFGNATSGTITLQTVTGALGTRTLSLPAVTDTLVALSDIARFPRAQGIAIGVDFNSVADTAITISSPTASYRVVGVFVQNVGTTASLTNAQCGVFTSTGGGGTVILASGTALSPITSNASNTVGNSLFFGAPATTGLSQVILTSVSTLYFRITTAQGAAASGNVFIVIQPL